MKSLILVVVRLGREETKLQPPGVFMHDQNFWAEQAWWIAREQ